MMNNTIKSASNRSVGRLRWLGAPGLLACVAAVAGACASDQSDESVGYAQQAAVATTVLLNEVLYDPPGGAAADNAHQYIEITGTANGTLEEYYVVVVDGRSTGSPGAALAVVNLGTACSGACAIGSNGLLVITPAATGTFTFPTATTKVTSSYTMANNSGTVSDDYSILLVKSSTAIAVGADFDTANNGTLTPPTGVTLVDAVGWTESATGFVYGGVNITGTGAAKDSPDAIIRIAGNTTALTRNAWFYAEVSGATGTGTTLTGATASGTGAVPTDVTAITPGLPNTAASITPTGTAGAAGAAGATGAAAGSGNGGTAGGSQVGHAGNAGNAGNAGTAGQITIVLPTTGGTSATGGVATTAGTTGSPTTGGAATAGATGLSSGGAVSAGAPSTGGAVGTAGTANVAGNPGQAGSTSTTGTAGAESSLAGSAGVAAGKGGSGGVVNTGKGGASATVGGSGGSATAVGGTATAVGGKAAGVGGKAAGVGGKAAGVGGATGNGDTTAAEDDEGSCGCRIVGREKSPVSGIAMVMALAGALLSRRRRRG